MLRKIPVSINKTDFVFFDTNSQPISKQRFERAWKSLLREMDICAGAKLYRNQIVESKIDYTITPYFLRHTYCTMLCEKGVPLKTAQYLMGHASIEMTAEIYTHVTENMLESARLQINNTSKEKCCRNAAQ